MTNTTTATKPLVFLWVTRFAPLNNPTITARRQAEKAGYSCGLSGADEALREAERAGEDDVGGKGWQAWGEWAAEVAPNGRWRAVWLQACERGCHAAVRAYHARNAA